MTVGWREKQDHHDWTINILLWVLSALILGSTPLILTEKIIVKSGIAIQRNYLHIQEGSLIHHTHRLIWWAEVQKIFYKNTALLTGCGNCSISGFRFMKQIACSNVYT